MKYLVIKRKDGSVSTVRYECELAVEKSLTYEEEIIKELYHKNEELEQQVEELKKELQANNMFTNEKIKNYNSGYEKLVDIKIGSHHVTKK